MTDFEHDVEACEDDHEAERWPRRAWRRLDRRVLEARTFWRLRDVNTVALVQPVHRVVLQDEPRLRAYLDDTMVDGLDRARLSPLGWRRTDARWALGNLRRAIRGQAMLPLPYDVKTTVQTSDQAPGYFERNMTLIRAERRRIPRVRR